AKRGAETTIRARTAAQRAVGTSGRTRIGAVADRHAVVAECRIAVAAGRGAIADRDRGGATAVGAIADAHAVVAAHQCTGADRAAVGAQRIRAVTECGAVVAARL